MTQDQFTNAIDGLVNDFENAIIDGKELRDGICDMLLTAVKESRAADEALLEQIKDQLYVAAQRLGAKSDLLATIGSWGDSMTGEEVLSDLKILNQ